MSDHQFAMLCGPNDGGVKRGDREDTGDLDARHKDGVSEAGSGVAGDPRGSAAGISTATTDSLAESRSEGSLSPDDVLDFGDGVNNLHVTDAGDPSLGLTNVPGHPAEDWAADTGPSHTAESEDNPRETPPVEPDFRKRPRSLIARA